MARKSKALRTARAVGTKAFSIAKNFSPFGRAVSVTQAAVSTATGRKTGVKRRKVTPAKLQKQIKILELKKKLAKIRGY